jgi:hypothetical protein
MPIPTAYAGRGTLLLYSADNVTYTSLGQMQQFEHDGSKQTLVDQTNIGTVDNFTRAIAVRVDAGEIDLTGVLDPQNPTYLAVQQFHVGNTLVYWRVRLVDGSTFTFQAFVSEFKAFSAKVNKIYMWSGKLRLSGGLTPALL